MVYKNSCFIAKKSKFTRLPIGLYLDDGQLDCISTIMIAIGFSVTDFDQLTIRTKMLEK